MHEIGLYHPRIHFRSDSWIKVAALYWTKLARIVPRQYLPHDSETVRMLRDELDFVMDVDPQEAHGRPWDRACEEFLGFIRENRAELRRYYGVEGSKYTWTDYRPAGVPFGFESWNDAYGEPLVAEVADFKLAQVLRGSLIDHGLAFANPDRPAYEPSSLLMHPDLARVYMSALAEDLARANRLCPTTDDASVYAVGTGWTEDRMRNLLLPPRKFRLLPRKSKYLNEGRGAPDLIGMIAIRAVIPRDIDQIPTKKIVQIRKSLTPHFIAFRSGVDTVTDEVNQRLEGIQDPSIIRAYLEQEAHEQLLVPVKKLRDEMRRMKIDTATATLTFKYEVPALAGLVAGGVVSHEPLLAGSAAVALGLLGLIRGARRDAATHQAQSPVSYLMLLEDQLEARSTLQRAARQIRKITGLT